MTFVTQPARSAAPHTPRILLVGPRGSGKTSQAAMLAAKYRIVDGGLHSYCFPLVTFSNLKLLRWNHETVDRSEYYTSRCRLISCIYSDKVKSLFYTCRQSTASGATSFDLCFAFMNLLQQLFQSVSYFTILDQIVLIFRCELNCTIQ